MEPVTIILPVLYAVWPVEKTFPVEMDFEIFMKFSSLNILLLVRMD